jgi:ribosome maturation factor RimP
MRPLQEITEILEEKLRYMRLSLYDIKFTGTGRHGLLRIYIDKPGGITIDDCEEASNALSVILDVENFSAAPYTLEVSSPGLDRKLTLEKHFNTVIGHDLQLLVKDENDKQKTIIGKLTDCDSASVTLELEDEQTITVPLSSVVYGKIDIRFQ